VKRLAKAHNGTNSNLQ